MHIKRAIFTNFGPFEQLDVKLERGLVGIHGRNGVGKSTILDGIYSALTNDFGRFAGKREECVYCHAGERDESSIYLEGSHDDVGFQLLRSLRPNSQELRVDGITKAITKAGDIQEKLEQQLGVDRKLIDTYVFVQQWKMFGFMELQPAKRAEAFQYLCRTTKAIEICQACDKLLKEHAGDTTVQDNSDELVTVIARLKSELEQLEAQLADEQKLLLSDKSYESAQRIVRSAETRARLKESIKETKTEIVALVTTHDEVAAARKKADARLARRKEEVEGKAAAAKKAEQALADWDRYEKESRRTRKLQAEAEELTQERTNRLKPKPLGEEIDLERIQTEIAKLKSELERSKEIVRLFDEEGKVVCPTCGTHAEDLGQILEQARRDLEHNPKQLEKLIAKRDAQVAYDKALRKWEEWNAGFEARRAANLENLKALLKVEQPEGSKEELEEVVDALASFQAEVTTLEKTARTAATNEASAATRLEEKEKALAKLKKQLEETDEDSDKLEKARIRLDEHMAATTNIARLETRIEGIQRECQSHQKQLDRLRLLLQRGKKIRRALKLMTRLRDEVMHRDQLPNRVAQGNLINMEGDVNDALGILGNPFWVEADPSLSFSVHFPGEPARRAERLSGGQKAVLAMAFRSGVGSLFGAEIGMMALDEPTAGLDQDNLAYLSDALKRLATEIRGRRQILIITHAEALLPAFDQVIEIAR